MPAHLFLAHFPLALLVVGAAADAVGVAVGSMPVRRWAGVLLMLGAAAALLAFLTGSGALSDLLGRVPPGHPRIEAHTQWGGAGIWLLVGTGMLRAVWREHLSGPRGWVCLAAALVSALLVVAVSLSGTAISHGSYGS